MFQRKTEVMNAVAKEWMAYFKKRDPKKSIVLFDDFDEYLTSPPKQ